MAGSVGGDLATLQELHRSLGQNIQKIAEVKASIDRSMRGTVWTGANSDKFRQAWEGFKPTLEPKLTQALTDAQTDIKNQHNNIAAATGEAARI